MTTESKFNFRQPAGGTTETASQPHAHKLPPIYSIVGFLGFVCLLETAALIWLWPRAHRLDYRQTEAGVAQTFLVAKPGETVIVKTNEPNFQVGIWENGSGSHVGVTRNWSNGRNYDIGLWTDRSRQSIEEEYTLSQHGQVSSAQAFDQDGIPGLRAAGTHAAMKYFRRGAVFWDEIPQQAWPAASP